MSAIPSAPSHLGVVFASMMVLHPEKGDLAFAIVKDIPIIKTYQPKDLEIKLKELYELELYEAIKNRNNHWEMSRQAITTYMSYNDAFIKYLDILIHWFDLFIKRLDIWLNKLSKPNCGEANVHIDILKNALINRDLLLPGESFYQKRWNLVKTKTILRAEMLNIDFNILRFFKINVNEEDFKSVQSELLKKFAKIATENRLSGIRPTIEFTQSKEEFEEDFYP